MYYVMYIDRHYLLMYGKYSYYNLCIIILFYAYRTWAFSSIALGDLFRLRIPAVPTCTHRTTADACLGSASAAPVCDLSLVQKAAAFPALEG